MSAPPADAASGSGSGSAPAPAPAPAAGPTLPELEARMRSLDSGELASKRKDYYDSWRAVAREEAEKTKQEEESEKVAAAAKLGLDKHEPKSEAEKRDAEKRAALREAKKQWEGRNAIENAQRAVIKDEVDAKREITSEEILHRPVLTISNARGCEYVLSDKLRSMIKLFVTGCERCTITLKCAIITQHVEIAHCTDVEFIVAIPTQTVQADLCDRLKVRYNQNCLYPGHRVYHAGCKDIEVHHWTSDRVEHNYTDAESTYQSDDKPKEEWQFITHLVDDALKTERVRHAHGIMPLTEAELSKLAGTEEIDRAHVRKAETKKVGGNEAFKSGEFYQAAVFYTEAMELAPQNKEILCTCLCNRAACQLKLGRLEEALDDANACIELDDTYVKAWFRKGMAFHAMKKYGPAIEALSRAEKLEPANKQIREALGFAKTLHEKRLREEREKWES